MSKHPASSTRRRPHILPQQFFTGLTVEEGGKGAGTVLRAEMNVYGSKSSFRQRVAEPEPGRVLTESNIDDDLVTTFTFDPLDGGKCRLTIATDYSAGSALAAWIHRLTRLPIMRRIYKAELEQINSYMGTKKAAAGD